MLFVVVVILVVVIVVILVVVIVVVFVLVVVMVLVVMVVVFFLEAGVARDLVRIGLPADGPEVPRPLAAAAVESERARPKVFAARLAGMRPSTTFTAPPMAPEP